MTVTMIKKLNTVISLWLVSIIITLVIFGYQLNMFGFYIAGGVFAGILLSLNIFMIIFGFVSQTKKALERETEYTKF